MALKVNVLKTLTKSVLTPLRLIAAASVTYAAMYKKMFAAMSKKMFGSGHTTLIILNEEMNDILKIIKSREESGLLIKSSSKTIKNEAREQKGGFLGMLLDTSGAILVGNLQAFNGTIRAGEGAIRAGQNF